MNLKNFALHRARLSLTIFTLIAVSGYLLSYGLYYNLTREKQKLTTQIEAETRKRTSTQKKLSRSALELEKLKQEDQYLINRKLEQDIGAIETTYGLAVDVYEKLLDLKEVSKKTEEFDGAYARILTMLSERNYASAEAELKDFSARVVVEKNKVLASFVIPANAPQSNTPPSSGYSRQVVTTDLGEFLVSIVTADLNSARVIVDTASDGDCSDNCPVLPLAAYVSRNGAFAGINGSYFCPA